MSSYLFVCEYQYQCPAILWFTVCVYTSLDRVCFSLFLWISVLVFGYVVIHCTCICTSINPCLSVSFPLNASTNVRLYCHWLYVYSYVSWSAFFSVFLCLSQCPRILSLILRVYLCHLIHVFLSLFVSECVYQCPAILSFILGVYVRLLIRVSHSLFLWMFPSVLGYIVIDCTCIGRSLDPCFSHSLSLFGYIIGNLHECEEALWSRSREIMHYY